MGLYVCVGRQAFIINKLLLWKIEWVSHPVDELQLQQSGADSGDVSACSAPMNQLSTCCRFWLDQPSSLQWISRAESLTSPAAVQDGKDGIGSWLNMR